MRSTFILQVILVAATNFFAMNSAFASQCVGTKNHQGLTGSLEVQGNQVLKFVYLDANKLMTCIGKEWSAGRNSAVYAVEKTNSPNCAAARSFTVGTRPDGKIFVDLMWPQFGSEPGPDSVVSFLCNQH